MLDLHCHLLPAIDDGAVDLEMALTAVGDGIHTVACTPHIYPGVYDNHADGIRAAIRTLQRELDARGIALRPLEGADVHLDVDLIGAIREGACRRWRDRVICCWSHRTTLHRRVSRRSCSS